MPKRSNPPIPKDIDLKQLRKSAGLLQKEVAKHFFVTITSVHRWERRLNNPHPVMLNSLLNFYKEKISQNTHFPVHSQPAGRVSYSSK